MLIVGTLQRQVGVGGGNSANDEMTDSFSFLRCEARELNILKQGKGGTK